MKPFLKYSNPIFNDLGRRKKWKFEWAERKSCCWRLFWTLHRKGVFLTVLSDYRISLASLYEKNISQIADLPTVPLIRSTGHCKARLKRSQRHCSFKGLKTIIIDSQVTSKPTVSIQIESSVYKHTMESWGDGLWGGGGVIDGFIDLHLGVRCAF